MEIDLLMKNLKKVILSLNFNNLSLTIVHFNWLYLKLVFVFNCINNFMSMSYNLLILIRHFQMKNDSKNQNRELSLFTKYIRMSECF
jgi:hypothetical protein